MDDSHELTLRNGVGVEEGGKKLSGLALTCHGPSGADSPGHALATHRSLREGSADDYERHPDLASIPFPCRWCGCTESMVLAALGARPRDKYTQAEAQRDGRCRCGQSGYRVGKSVLCLTHLAERVGLLGVLQARP